MTSDTHAKPARFKKISTAHTRDEQIDTFVLEIRPGHTITREDHTSRLGAGRKGRAAEVTMYRVLDCTCGGHLGYGGLTVARDLANLPHFENAAEREAYEANQARLLASIQESLGL